MFWSDLGDFGFGSDPWFSSTARSLKQLQDEMNQLLEDIYPPFGGRAFPAVNVWSNADEVVVTAELPGVDSKSLDLSVMGNTLTIRGERPKQELSEKEKYLRHERGYGTFSRTLDLPYAVDSDKVEAVCKNGILKVVLPRAEADKPKKIAVR